MINQPEWTHNAVFYEIYPQSFYDSDGDGVGDLQGVIEKLDHVVDAGFNAIWLNPFYQSPMRDAGYDVSDFYKVDPRYGDNATAERLFKRAKELGLRVIIDLVPGHTALEHPWFQESQKPNASRPYRNWFVWTDSTWNKGGDWKSQMIHGFSNRDGNYLSNFFWSQPALNFGFTEPDPNESWQLSIEHEDVQLLWQEMQNIMRYWLSLGVDGFRVDMADSIIRNDPGHVGVRRFWRETREVLSAEFPDLFLIAEGHPTNVLDGEGFNAAFIHWLPEYWQLFRPSSVRSQTGDVSDQSPYFSKEVGGDFSAFLKVWREQYDLTNDKGYLSLPSGNHDLPRLAQGQSDDELELIYAFVLSWPGVPFFYYGEEIGIRQQSENNPIHEGHYAPRNGARTPMQWTSGNNSGFSSGDASSLYLPVDPEPSAVNVEAQMQDTRSLLNRLKSLLALRKQTASLDAAQGIEIYAEGQPGEPLIFRRGNEGDCLFCCFFPSAKDYSWSCDKSPLGTALECVASGSNSVEIVAETIQATGPAWAYFKEESL